MLKYVEQRSKASAVVGGLGGNIAYAVKLATGSEFGLYGVVVFNLNRLALSREFQQCCINSACWADGDRLVE